MLLTGLLFVSVVACGQALILEATKTRVTKKLTPNITISCSYEGKDNNLKPLAAVFRIRLQKFEKGSQWNTVAKINNNNQAVTTTFADVQTSGFAGKPNDTFLTLHFDIASESSIGLFQCEVNGFDTDDELEVVKSNQVNIYERGVSLDDLLNSILELKATEHTDHSTDEFRLGLLEKAVRLLESQGNSRASAIAGVQQTMNTMVDNLKKTNEDLNQTMNSDLKKINGDLKKINDDLKKTNDDLKKTNADLKKNDDGLNKTNEDLKKTNDDLKKTNADLKKNDDGLNKTNEDLKKTNEDLKKTNDDLKKTNADLKKNDDSLNKTNEDLKKTNEDLKKTNEDLITVQGQLQAQLDINGNAVGSNRPWPEGSYALLNTSSGCSNSGTFDWDWEESYAQIATHNGATNQDNTSTPIHLSENPIEELQGKNVFTFRFCSKSNSSAGPAWPKGSYCFNSFKLHDYCPAHFGAGFIQIGRQRSSVIDKSKNLPSFSAHADYSYMWFCCRQDGDADHPILLPSQDPFYLYRFGGKCQEVIGMDVSNEWIYLDSGNDALDAYWTNNHPDGHIKHVRIELCYYTPKA